MPRACLYKGTFRFTKEDASPPHRKPLPISRAFSTTAATQLFPPYISFSF
uniref:Uncharacterized protein n=1 Tax=Medicago truncatula TaxID=3880 RepID=A2Q2Q1_MEDTR|nr:hypothetical protein MtrDRAFT_AC151524g1v2 [Medicago truncatula]